MRQAEGNERVVAGQRSGERQRSRCQQRAPRCAALRPRRVEAAPFCRAVLDRQKHRTCPFTAEHDALHEAKDHEQDRRQCPNLIVGRQEPNERGRGAHGGNGSDQHRPPADDVAEPAANDAADRASHHAYAIGEKRQQRADQRIERREEDLVEDEARHRVVEREIIPFQNGADRTRCGDPRHRCVLLHLRSPTFDRAYTGRM